MTACLDIIYINNFFKRWTSIWQTRELQIRSEDYLERKYIKNLSFESKRKNEYNKDLEVFFTSTCKISLIFYPVKHLFKASFLFSV